MPNMLFYGNSGIGKTTVVNIIINYLYGNDFEYVKKINVSQNNGIDMVRDELLNFCMINFDKQKHPFKTIILDEFDQLTIDAQSALKVIMEDYHENIRFLLVCNYENKILQAIKSRCVNYAF